MENQQAKQKLLETFVESERTYVSDLGIIIDGFLFLFLFFYCFVFCVFAWA